MKFLKAWGLSFCFMVGAVAVVSLAVFGLALYINFMATTVQDKIGFFWTVALNTVLGLALLSGIITIIFHEIDEDALGWLHDSFEFLGQGGLGLVLRAKQPRCLDCGGLRGHPAYVEETDGITTVPYICSNEFHRMEE